MNLFLLGLAAVAFAVGGVFMKWSQGLTVLWPSVLLFVCFGAGAACQALAMRTAEMGRVYLAVLGAESILAFLLSVVLLREAATLEKVGAVALITVGILLLHR
jgi:small multidrug resistance pump/quaternary ammonium compound-resistance protein SugE